MDQIPPFLIGQKYFHHTDEVRPPAMVSTQRNSIWNPPHPKRSNGTHMVITYNGRDVFLFIYCRICKQWRMPNEGGHTGSHHQQFLIGGICLPVGHTSWMIHYRINVHYLLDFQVADVHWNPNLALPGIIEFPQVDANPLAIMAPPPMEEENNALVVPQGEAPRMAIMDPMLEEESDDEDEIVRPRFAARRNGRLRTARFVLSDDESSQEVIPPQRNNRMIDHGVDENNVSRRTSGRPVRDNAGTINRFVPSPPRGSKRPHRDAFGDATNRDSAHDED